MTGDQGSDDAEIGAMIAELRRIGVTVHVRGSDHSPVVEWRDKRSGRVVGGIEMKKRLSVVT